MPKRESFIDRYQLWPFYRRRKYCEETMETVREVWREMKEGYTADDYPNAVRAPRDMRYLYSKHDVSESPEYLKGRQRMTEQGYDIEILDLAIAMLCRKQKLPSNYKIRRLRGKMRGYKGCRIDHDWLLIYRYDHDRLVLHSLDTDNVD